MPLALFASLTDDFVLRSYFIGEVKQEFAPKIFSEPINEIE